MILFWFIKWNFPDDGDSRYINMLERVLIL